MNLFTGIVVYVLIWWVVLFTVLPWKSRPPSHPGLGHATSAPKAPNLGIKFLVTSLIAAVIWGIVYMLIQKGIIDYRAIAIQMMKEDHGL
jgi:predicted secreted protein